MKGKKMNFKNLGIDEDIINVLKNNGITSPTIVQEKCFGIINEGSDLITKAQTGTGKMYKNTYRDRGLAPRNLSRVLEDSGTVTSALVPWNTCGATMSTFLGVPTLAYLPYAFFNILSPIITVTFGFLGITILKLENDPSSPEYIGTKKSR